MRCDIHDRPRQHRHRRDRHRGDNPCHDPDHGGDDTVVCLCCRAEVEPDRVLQHELGALRSEQRAEAEGLYDQIVAHLDHVDDPDRAPLRRRRVAACTLVAAAGAAGAIAVVGRVRSRRVAA